MSELKPASVHAYLTRAGRVAVKFPCGDDEDEFDDFTVEMEASDADALAKVLAALARAAREGGKISASTIAECEAAGGEIEIRTGRRGDFS